jgi:hypothetical protein
MMAMLPVSPLVGASCGSLFAVPSSPSSIFLHLSSFLGLTSYLQAVTEKVRAMLKTVLSICIV